MPSLDEQEAWLSAKFVKVERSNLILGLSVLVYGVVFSSLTILRYYAFKTCAWDFGIFTQSYWTTVHTGRFFYHTCELFVNPSGSFFGVHFSPILFLIVPFYWIVPIPETLLVFQAFILGLAALPIYKLAREYAGGRTVGLIFASAYLLYPAIQFVNWYDFHVQAFLPLLLGYTVYYITKENWPKYSLFLFLSLICEEHVAFITFFVGIYIAWKYKGHIISAFKKRRLGEKKLLIPLFTMIISVIWYWFTLWQRDTFFPTNPLAVNEFLGSANFAILGAKNPLEIPLLVIIRPLNAVQALVYDWQVKLLYLFLLFGPLAFFALKSPSALIPVIPWFGFSLLSQTLAHHAFGHQYEAYFTSFIFAAAIFGLRKNLLKKHGLKDISGSLKKVVVCSLIFFVTTSPISPLIGYLFSSYTSIYIGEHEGFLSEVLMMIPSNASILTQNNLFPQVSNRLDAYVVPNRFLDTSIRDLAISFVNQTMDKVEYLLVDNNTDPTATLLILSLLKTHPQFTLKVSRDNGTILLYKRER